MKAIVGLTLVYVIVIAIAFSAFITSRGSTVDNVLFGEAVFALPMVISSVLAVAIQRATARRILLIFEIAFSIFSLAVFVSTFTGEHDAQYQLVLLAIPLVGFPAIAIAGALAAVSPRRAK